MSSSGSATQGESRLFPLTTGRERGYQIQQVDEFLELARSSYEGKRSQGLTAADVRAQAFKLERHGYVPRYVDAALDRLEEVFYERERRDRMQEIGDAAWWSETRSLLSEVRGRIGRPRGARFRRTSIFASGYRRSQVDAFLDRVGQMFANREISVTPAEVREVVFHTQLGGYDEAQVDALLDAIVDLILATR